MPGPNDGQPAASFPADGRTYHSYTSVGESGLVPATPFTAESGDDPVSGGTMTTLVFPEDVTAVAIKIDGDEFPRLLINSAGQILLGDGTTDPWNDAGGIIKFDAGKVLVSDIRVGNGSTVSDFTFTNKATGPLLRAPDDSYHRVKVANDGTLSTEVVA